MSAIHPTESVIDAAVTRLRQNGFQNETEVRQKLIQILGYKPNSKVNRTTDLDIILSRDGAHFGIVLNPYSRPCRMEGCLGVREYVRWDDGEVTYPCSKGLQYIAPHIEKIG